MEVTYSIAKKSMRSNGSYSYRPDPPTPPPPSRLVLSGLSPQVGQRAQQFLASEEAAKSAGRNTATMREAGVGSRHRKSGEGRPGRVCH